MRNCVVFCINKMFVSANIMFIEECFNMHDCIKIITPNELEEIIIGIIENICCSAN